MSEPTKYPSASAFVRIMGAELQNLIQSRRIQQIQIYSFTHSVLRSQSKRWRLKEYTIQVGQESYELHKIVAVRTLDQTLQLYF